MSLRLLLTCVIGFILMLPAQAAEVAGDQPLAVIFGEKVYSKDLVASISSAPAKDPVAEQRARGEAMRGRVWKAVFEDYTRRRHIVPSEAEIASQVEGHQRMKKHMEAERVQQRASLVAELKLPSLSETRRQAAQQHLDTLDKLAAFNTQREQELRDPERRKMSEASERMVAEHWVRAWKLNQTLYREFGGRIIFQQAGWEPTDAYRKLLDQYASKQAFVIHDPALRAAVYSYFEHKFVYAEEAKARFYFEKPYWERTPEEMKAAGF